VHDAVERRARAHASRKRPLISDQAIAQLAAGTPLTEDEAAVALGFCLAAGIPAVDAYPTLRALAAAGVLRVF
jgi:hypothetical protein